MAIRNSERHVLVALLNGTLAGNIYSDILAPTVRGLSSSWHPKTRTRYKLLRRPVGSSGWMSTTWLESYARRANEEYLVCQSVQSANSVWLGPNQRLLL